MGQTQVVQSKLANILIPFLLVGVIVSPSIGQWAHIINTHHTEVSCSGGEVHFHATEVGCELTATFTTPFTFKSLKAIKFNEVKSILLQPLTPTQAYAFQQIQFFHLRGPPQLLTFA